MKTIELPDQDYEFLKELQHELNTQTTDGNAQPVYWGVMETREEGVPDGCGEPRVYSPKYSDPNEHPICHLHSVICDINFNIVFDPNPNYDGILCYPYSKLIGYNGIRAIDTFNKLK